MSRLRAAFFGRVSPHVSQVFQSGHFLCTRTNSVAAAQSPTTTSSMRSEIPEPAPDCRGPRRPSAGEAGPARRSSNSLRYTRHVKALWRKKRIRRKNACLLAYRCFRKSEKSELSKVNIFFRSLFALLSRLLRRAMPLSTAFFVLQGLFRQSAVWGLLSTLLRTPQQAHPPTAPGLRWMTLRIARSPLRVLR